MEELDPKLKIKSDRGVIKALKIFRNGNHTWPAFWGENYQISKEWTEMNNMVIDVVTHLVFDHYKEKGQQERVFSYPDIDSVRVDEKLIHDRGPHTEEGMNTTIEVEASVFRNLTEKHYMTYKDILKLFVDTANTGVICSQPILMKREKRVRNKSQKSVTKTEKGAKEKQTLYLKDTSVEEWVTYNWVTMPFEVGWDENEKNPTKFKVKLNTIFGRVLVHNVRAKGYNYFDRRVYNLTGNAQNLYRYFILIEQGFKKKRHIDAYENDIVERLDLHTPTVKKTILGYIEELKSLKIVFICETFKDIYGKRFYRIYVLPLELQNKLQPVEPIDGGEEPILNEADQNSEQSVKTSEASDETCKQSDQTCF